MKYSIRTPCTAYIFGSKVKVDFEFTPLMEKLDFPKICFFISEKESVCTKDDREDVPLVSQIQSASSMRYELGLCYQQRSRSLHLGNRSDVLIIGNGLLASGT